MASLSTLLISCSFLVWQILAGASDQELPLIDNPDEAFKNYDGLKDELYKMASPDLDVAARIKSLGALGKTPLTDYTRHMLEERGFSNPTSPLEAALVESRRRVQDFNKQISNLKDEEATQEQFSGQLFSPRITLNESKAANETQHISEFIKADGSRLLQRLSKPYDLSKKASSNSVEAEDEESREQPGERLVLEPASLLALDLNSPEKASSFLQENSEIDPLLAAIYAAHMIHKSGKQKADFDKFFKHKNNAVNMKSDKIKAMTVPIAQLLKNIKLYKTLKTLRDALKRVQKTTNEMHTHGQAEQQHDKHDKHNKKGGPFHGIKSGPHQQKEGSKNTKKIVLRHTKENRKRKAAQVGGQQKNGRGLKQILRNINDLNTEPARITQQNVHDMKAHENNLFTKDPFSHVFQEIVKPDASGVSYQIGVRPGTTNEDDDRNRDVKKSNESSGHIADGKADTEDVEGPAAPLDPIPWAEEAGSSSAIQIAPDRYKTRMLARRHRLKKQIQNIVEGRT